MRLIMNRDHSYTIYGKLVRAGDEFEVPEDEGRTWILLGRATEAPRRRAGRYNRTDMRAEDE